MNANSHGHEPHFHGAENLDPQAARSHGDGAQPDMIELLAAAERGELSEEAIAELGQQATASVLESLEPALDAPTPLEAEIWVSSLIGHLTDMDEAEADGAAENLPLQLLESIAMVGSRQSLGFLRVVESLGETEEQRAAARVHADQLAAEGLTEPTWLGQVGTATPGDCWGMTDIHGEQMSLLCEFAYGSHPHALLALIEFTESGGWVRDLTAVDEDDLPDVKHQLEATAQAIPGLMNLEQVDPAQGRQLLESGLTEAAQQLAAEAEPEEAISADDIADLDPQLAEALSELDLVEDEAAADDEEEDGEGGIAYLRLLALARARVMPAAA